MEYQIGYGKTDITPPVGIRGRVGITHQLSVPGDPVLVQALYFSDGNAGVLQLTADVVGITGETNREIRERVAKKTGIEQERILITATHTHACPWTWTQQARDAAEIGIEFLDRSWFNRFLAAFEKAASEAIKEAVPSLLKAGTAEVRDVASNRLEHGWRSSWTEDPAMRAAPTGSIDPQVRVLAVCDLEGNPRVMVANYACHPTAFGGGEVPFASPDFPYFASRRISVQLERPVPLVYWMGCAGDINTGKFCAEGNDEEVAGFGVRLGDAILEAWKSSETVDGPLEVIREQHHFEPGDWMLSVEDAQKRFDELGKPVMERMEAGEQLTYSDYHEWRMALKNLDFCKVIQPEGMPVELIRFRVGPLALLFVPGEWFHRIGISLASTRPMLGDSVPGAWVTTMADVDLNYIADPESLSHREWYGVSPDRVRILSDQGILDMIEASRALLEKDSSS